MIWLIATILGAILYRLGGCIQTKIRDFGVPTVATGYLLTLGIKLHSWGFWGLVAALLAHFGLLLASLTTYWKKKGTDAHWYNWVFTGLGYSLAYLPYAFLSGIWAGFLARIILTTAGIVWWSEREGDAVKEEFGRGFIQNITIPILTIG